MKDFLGKLQQNGPAGRKRYERKSNRTRQKNKRGDSKVESNDRPEIPDRGETSDILPPPVIDPHMELNIQPSSLSSTGGVQISTTT